jgi:hypothetical protein
MLKPVTRIGGQSLSPMTQSPTVMRASSSLVRLFVSGIGETLKVKCVSSYCEMDGGLL